MTVKSSYFKFLLLIPIFGICNLILAQGSADSYIYVHSPAPEAVPDASGNVSDTDLQQLLNSSDYQSYSQSFLGA